MTPRLVLASASPRRRELLRSSALPFAVRARAVDETLRPGRVAEEEVLRLARDKARKSEAEGDDCILAADTLVALGDAILEKPRNAAQAARMLRRLRSREHRVVTGVAVASDSEVYGLRVTRVWMRPYSDQEIGAYVASGEPLDKAGGYAIQDPAFRPVARIDGCYCNVVGLPLRLLLNLLARAGYPLGQPVRPPQCRGCPDWEDPLPAWLGDPARPAHTTCSQLDS